MKFKNAIVIEDGVFEEIHIKESNLFSEPVESLDELLFWEETFDRQKRDYAIAQFEVKIAREGTNTTETVVRYGIFCNDACKTMGYDDESEIEADEHL